MDRLKINCINCHAMASLRQFYTSDNFCMYCELIPKHIPRSQHILFRTRKIGRTLTGKPYDTKIES